MLLSTRLKNLSRTLLVQLLDHLKCKVDQGFISLVPVLKNVPNKIASLDLPDAKGAKVRSRFQWAEEGEASTKFFLRLEKNKRSVSLISAMRKEDGSLASDINSI